MPIFEKKIKLKRNLQYIFLLKKYKNIINYKNIELLKVFLKKSGQIHSRLDTFCSNQEQKKIAKSIRKARVLKLIPFVFKSIIKKFQQDTEENI
jgi:ribosomal protein S18